MDKKDFVNNELTRILVGIVFDEYMNLKRFVSSLRQIYKKQSDLNSILDTLNFRKGNEISVLKGFIFVPDIIKMEGYSMGDSEFHSMKKIRHEYGGLEHFIRHVVPDDNATLIGKDGFSFGYTLETIKDSEDILQKINNDDSLTIKDLLGMYSTSDISHIGQRARQSIGSHVILKNQDLLFDMYKESPEKFEDLKDVARKNSLVNINYNNMHGFYNGEIICKKQTASDNTTLTGPIKIFSLEEEMGMYSEFDLMPFSRCTSEVRKEFSVKKKTNTYLGFVTVPKKDYIFDEGSDNDAIVGSYKMYRFDKKVVFEESLIRPEDIGIKPNVSYSNLEKLVRLAKMFVPRKD